MTSAKSASESKQASVEAVRNKLFGGPVSPELQKLRDERAREQAAFQEYATHFPSSLYARACWELGFSLEDARLAELVN